MKYNIISGESKTGKTAIIEIINYCLGSDSCKIPEGFIKENVKWFALILTFKHEEIFVARINPNSIGKKSTSEIYYTIGSKIKEIPGIERLIPNSNIDLFKRVLEGKLGINEYTHKPEYSTRDKLAVSFSHSRLYCFQPQDLIAQKNNIFFNQNSEKGGFVTQSIVDTLPYFLGAVREDTLMIEQQIAFVKKKLRILYRELRSSENIQEKGISKLFELIEEAKEVEVISPFEEVDSEEYAIKLLSEIINWTNNENDLSGNNEVLNNLIRQRRSLKEDIEKIKTELYAAKSFAEEARGYTNEVKEQEQRLKSINLYQIPRENKEWNSLIGQEVDYISPTIENINKALLELRQNLASTTRDKPKLRNYIHELDGQLSSKLENLSLISNQINAVYKEQEESEKLKNLNIRRGKVIGRVSLFLESLDISKDYSKIKLEINDLEEQLNELDSLISKEEKEERISAIMNKINLQMSNWSNLLDIEYKGSPIRFDPKKIMLFADTNEKSIPLSQMGSGANWVSYHLLIHFALHKHFIQTKRPVPNFLIIDQPSQVYYPPEKDGILKGNLPSSDEVAVKQMFDFMFQVVEELDSNLQIIITDHAKLRYEKFESSIIEIWRNNDKLVPLNWANEDE